jgi:hypothetical protein
MSKKKIVMAIEVSAETKAKFLELRAAMAELEQRYVANPECLRNIISAAWQNLQDEKAQTVTEPGPPQSWLKDSAAILDNPPLR